jgi:DNA-binding winged helix-turn-helix (wHTH) protein
MRPASAVGTPPGTCGGVHADETIAKCALRTVAAVEVALVQWPAEHDRREELRRARQPRLLLVEQGTPPIATDELEDWIRLPADDLDLRVRVEALRRRNGAAAATPHLDDDGVLRFGGGWVALPPVEARLMAALLDRFGAVVSRDALGRAGWPGGSPGRNALDVHVLRLRRRTAPLDLAIRTVRSRGYLLEHAVAGGSVVRRGNGTGPATSHARQEAVHQA